MNTGKDKASPQRFQVISLDEAKRRNLPEASDYYDEYRNALYEFDGEKPVRIVAVDGGEPEDQTFGRDWRWVPFELNKLARAVAAHRQLAEAAQKAADTFADFERTLGMLGRKPVAEAAHIAGEALRAALAALDAVEKS